MATRKHHTSRNGSRDVQSRYRKKESTKLSKRGTVRNAQSNHFYTFVIAIGIFALYFAVNLILRTNSSSQNFRGTDKKIEVVSPRDSTHVKICRYILSPKEEEETITEDSSLCLNALASTSSLTQIFFSTFLAHESRVHGFKISYAHRCDRYRTDKLFIQEFLPSPLVIPNEYVSSTSKDSLFVLCRNMIQDADQDGLIDAQRIMFGIPKEVADQFQEMIHQRGEYIPPSELSAVSNQGSAFIQDLDNAEQQNGIILLEKILPIVAVNMQTALADAANDSKVLKADKGVLSLKDGAEVIFGTAVVHLPCEDTLCQDVIVLPDYIYLENLPNFLRSIDIVVNPACVKNSYQCSIYAERLESTFRKFYPRAHVHLVLSNPSTIAVVTRLVQAEFILCGPGFGMNCLFPSLVRSFGRLQGRYTLLDGFAGSKTSSIISKISLPALSSLVYKPSEMNTPVSSSTAFGNDKEIGTFADVSPENSSGQCRFFRGRVGSWVQDLEYAAFAQYRTPLQHYSGHSDHNFQDHKKKYGFKYRPPTIYKWTESQFPACESSLISKEGMCDLLRLMNVRRIFILGDSLNLQLAQSLWMFLSTEGNSPTPRGTNEPNFRHTFSCPQSQNDDDKGFEYVFQFVRNDKLLENGEPVSIDKSQENCGGYCYPWTAEYISDPGRTILLVNTGAHIHDAPEFRAAIDRFVATFDNFNRLDDVVLFRTTVPGHWNCGRKGLAPFKTFDEYTKDRKENQVNDLHSWNRFPDYNDYATRVIETRKMGLFMQERKRASWMEVLDVFPTTILRPDGHASDEFRPDHYPTNDCLHYSLPGPIDWWSHLAFSHLIDIATSQSIPNA